MGICHLLFQFYPTGIAVVICPSLSMYNRYTRFKIIVKVWILAGKFHRRHLPMWPQQACHKRHPTGYNQWCLWWDEVLLITLQLLSHRGYPAEMQGERQREIQQNYRPFLYPLILSNLFLKNGTEGKWWRLAILHGHNWCIFGIWVDVFYILPKKASCHYWEWVMV